MQKKQIAPIISVKSLYKSFHSTDKDTVVLKNINLEVKEGEFLFIWGPSGCGKSTLLNSILGLEPPTKGKVFAFKNDLYKMSEDQRSRLRKKKFGVIFQQQNWIKSLTVLENVAFPLTLGGINKELALERADQMLKVVGMEEWADYYPTELSMGQQQKVSLARALAPEPQVLIADEPTGNLDHKSGVELLEILKKLNEMGKTIIMVSHDSMSVDYVSRVVKMFDGVLTDEIRDLKGKDLNKIKYDLVKSIQDEGKNSLENGSKDEITLKAKKRPVQKSPLSVKSLLKPFKFFFLLNYYFLYKILNRLTMPNFGRKDDRKDRSKNKFRRNKLNRFVNKVHQKVYKLLRREAGASINTFELIDMALKNMWNHKARSVVTILGMCIGIAVIVLLVSVGYGIEDLVISRIATLKEMRQIEISNSISNSISLGEKELDEIKSIDSVKKALPIIRAAGKVNYNGSETDTVVYGVEARYFDETSINVLEGNAFNDEADEDSNLVVVNEKFLENYGLESGYIGEEFDLTIKASGRLTQGDDITSDLITYKVGGVIAESNNPVIYLPIEDIKDLGVESYSMANVILDNEMNVPGVRKKIEVLGFTTSSIIDTVNTVEQMFNSLRLILALLGSGALLVASLGMINTLTVSLLERIREVGFMKVLGMTSDEVYDLFVTEAMTMGFIGGFAGLFAGFVIGEGISITLSIISNMRGFGSIDVTNIPVLFVLLVVLVSAEVGILTGLYPAIRATKISALDALRYE